MFKISLNLLCAELFLIATIIFFRKVVYEADIGAGYIDIFVIYLMTLILYIFRDINIDLYNRRSKNSTMKVISVAIMGIGFLIIAAPRLGLAR